MSTRKKATRKKTTRKKTTRKAAPRKKATPKPEPAAQDVVRLVASLQDSLGDLESIVRRSSDIDGRIASMEIRVSRLADAMTKAFPDLERHVGERLMDGERKWREYVEEVEESIARIRMRTDEHAQVLTKMKDLESRVYEVSMSVMAMKTKPVEPEQNDDGLADVKRSWWHRMTGGKP